MSKIFLISFLLISITANAQSTYRVYLTDENEKTSNPQLATSFAIITQIPEDSAWFVRQFDMKDTIMSSGYYKDEQMKIPHGKFIYYHKVPINRGFTFMGKLVIDTVNRISSTGYYINGVKTGRWLQINPDGTISSASTYTNGGQDYLFQKYDESTGKVAAEGYYVKNKREGDWCQLDTDSLSIYTIVFKHDKMVRQFDYRNQNFKGAVPHFDLGVFMSRQFDHYHFTKTTGIFVMSYIITKEGKVTNPKVITPFESEFDDIAVNAILSSKWKPALQNGQPVDQNETNTIYIINSNVQLSGKNILHKTYDLQSGVYQ
ncbi:MAG TPA: energy transducer TonB [Mucilaginibacter sp.]|jgi:antitoxin component YwqK of YwqJK toxin-antitoxin module